MVRKFPTDGDHEIVEIDAQDLVNGVLRAIRQIEDGIFYHYPSPKRCRICGGIQPEMWIYADNKEFRFTCTKVTTMNGAKVIAETDYKQFKEFLQSNKANHNHACRTVRRAFSKKKKPQYDSSTTFSVS